MAKDNQINRDFVVVGLGNMGASLTKGLLKSGMPQGCRLKVFDLHRDRLHAFADQDVTIVESLAELANQEICLILCIKPHDLKGLADTLGGKLHPNTLVISILAGTSIDQLETALSFKGPVVRSMPNIAATIGYAATAMCSNSACTGEHQAMADLIFNGVGEAHWTKEALMDTVTGLSGSGPAYIYMVIEALTDGGVKMGLPRDLSRKLSTQTVLGAAALVRETGLHPAILKDQVTTPAGTTISALHELEERGLRSMFVSAVVTATERSKALRDG